ncbi:tRNA glutamyl-Q(34) synthetase GluQRS [Aquimonas voraii]|uniref:Glutamyl-Q tRNA(Asp) synthetase n=1 Tax=Aquimonas voraii TaxID=265719 RepID=A0A1G6RRD7_9GAMM|nr:tRNA glutamyl-Q(34) synthetase GluQRS [Aquimonas voraii]SDD06981.1 glutamyl-Q tRNA(Asp) synthetase [Aquimonas voraii]
MGRFAPSPTGPLHLGSLLAAFGSWLAARSAGGLWRVRIEDVDRMREVPGAAQAQLATLRAFGLEPDGEVVVQSARGELYRSALDRLLDAGLAFSCRCSRSDLTASAGIHHRCVADPSGHAAALRLRVPAGPGSHIAFVDRLHGPIEQAVDAAVGDFVLKRADGCWAYQLAVVVDDAEQGITEVVRGADLLDSTPRQILLQRALGLQTPAYAHLPLVVDGEGRKLSKSLSALPVDPRDPLPALRWCWAALGQRPERVADAGSANALLQRAAAEFEFSRIPTGHGLAIGQNAVASPV